MKKAGTPLQKATGQKALRMSTVQVTQLPAQGNLFNLERKVLASELHRETLKHKAIYSLSLGMTDAKQFLWGGMPSEEVLRVLRENAFALDMGCLPDPPQDHSVSVAVMFGDDCRQVAWPSATTLTWAELVAKLTDHRQGEKDGPSIVPARMRGDARRKADADQIDVMMLDSDCGHNLNEIARGIKRMGWCAAIASTHSHEIARTKVKKADYEKFCHAREGAGPTQYLIEKKGYLARVAEGAREGVAEGEHIFLEHAPCPKFRIVLRLARPWKASDYKSQDDANAAWGRWLKATAAALGLHHDKSCEDTSRLFYLPRHAKGKTPVSRVLHGDACDPSKLPQSEPERAPAQLGKAATATAPRVRVLEVTVAETGEAIKFDFTQWAAGAGRRFKIVDALKARRPNVFRPYVAEGNRHHITCPFEEEHTNGAPDSATFVMNAGEGSNPGFTVHCCHAHCVDRDRLHFVARMVEDGCLQVEDLTNPAFLLPEPDIIEAAIDELNATRAVVPVGGRTMVLTETYERDGRVKVAYSRPEELHKWYANKLIPLGSDGKVRLVPKSEVWFKSSRRREYVRVVMEPEGAPEDEYNLWRGFAVEPDPHASCELFFAHLRDNVSNGDPALFRWLMAFLADMVQRPGTKPGVALVLRGGEGVGKSIVGKYVGALFPAYTVVVSHPRHVTGTFNAHLQDALLILIEEAFLADNKDAAGTLKHMVTSDRRMVEPKGIDAFEVRDFARLIVTSNNEHVVPAGEDARRFAVYDVGDARKQDRVYFAAIAEEMANGGTGALLHYLRSFDLSTVSVGEIPRTEALLDQKLASLDTLSRWWYTALREGSIDRSDEWPQSIERGTLRDSYTAFAKNLRAFPVDDGVFGRRFRELVPGLQSTQLRDGEARSRAYILPPLSECRSVFQKRFGQALAWGD